MGTKKPCPESSLWKGLLDGHQSRAVEEPLLAHLETCARCQLTLQEVAADPAWWGDVRRYLAARQPLAGPRFRQVLVELIGPWHGVLQEKGARG